MNHLVTAIQAFSNFWTVVAGSALATGFTVAGLVLIFATIFIAYIVSRTKPEDTPVWLRLAFFACLCGGLSLVATAPVVSWMEQSRNGIKQVQRQRSLANLGTNRRVDWLIRLIPYNPKGEPELAVSNLLTLGPKGQMFTFVASYHDLKGYTVRDAIRMTGGNILPGQHVSAIIFPRRFDVIPANAKGLLQVIDGLQSSVPTETAQRLNLGSLSEASARNLKNRDTLQSWAWNGYSSHYASFCKLAQEFRCGSYFAQAFVTINSDWVPLGFSRRIPPKSEDGVCGPDALKVCEIRDWDQVTHSFGDEFGARAFLVKNYPLKELVDLYLIDFEQPEQQLIPDIGVPEPND